MKTRDTGDNSQTFWYHFLYIYIHFLSSISRTRMIGYESYCILSDSIRYFYKICINSYKIWFKVLVNSRIRFHIQNRIFRSLLIFLPGLAIIIQLHVPWWLTTLYLSSQVASDLNIMDMWANYNIIVYNCIILACWRRTSKRVETFKRKKTSIWLLIVL